MARHDDHSGNGNGNGDDEPHDPPRQERGIRKRLRTNKKKDQPKLEFPEGTPGPNTRDARVDNWTDRARRAANCRRDVRGRWKQMKSADGGKVAELALIGMTQREISGVLGIDQKMVAARYAQEFSLGKATRRLALREAQFAKAVGGDATMLIWLGKNELGQSDRVEVNNNALVVHEHRALIAHIMHDPAANAAAELLARQALALEDQRQQQQKQDDTTEIEGDDDANAGSTN